jgi:hypothetical protein
MMSKRRSVKSSAVVQDAVDPVVDPAQDGGDLAAHGVQDAGDLVHRDEHDAGHPVASFPRVVRGVYLAPRVLRAEDEYLILPHWVDVEGLREGDLLVITIQHEHGQGV